MLNCVQETSVRAAVVLSVGLLMLLSMAWVVAAVLSGTLKVLTDRDTDVTPALFTTVLLALAEGETALGMEVSVMVLVADKKENTLD